MLQSEVVFLLDHPLLQSEVEWLLIAILTIALWLYFLLAQRNIQSQSKLALGSCHQKFNPNHLNIMVTWSMLINIVCQYNLLGMEIEIFVFLIFDRFPWIIVVYNTALSYIELDVGPSLAYWVFFYVRLYLHMQHFALMPFKDRFLWVILIHLTNQNMKT